MAIYQRGVLADPRQALVTIVPDESDESPIGEAVADLVQNLDACEPMEGVRDDNRGAGGSTDGEACAAATTLGTGRSIWSSIARTGSAATTSTSCAMRSSVIAPVPAPRSKTRPSPAFATISSMISAGYEGLPRR